jgi:5'-nucleotidase
MRAKPARGQEDARMNYIAAWLVALAAAACTAAHAPRPPPSPPPPVPSAATATTPVKVKVIAFNDFHGALTPDGLVAVPGEPPIIVGGIDYLGAYVAKLSADNPNHVVVSAGDLIGASPLISGLYHDEATIEAMNLLGLDFTSVGNHEFDRGPTELTRKQHGGCFPGGVSTCLENHAFPGASFTYLAANVRDVASGRTLFPPYVIREFQGIRVAFIGLGLKGTPSIVTPQAVSGLEFEDEAQTVNALIPSLQAQGVHAFVVMIHQGGVQAGVSPGAVEAVDGCAGGLGDPAASPILDIVAHLDDAIDVVISGHTHKAYNCLLPNRAGRRILVTQAGYYGHVITDIDLLLDPASGRVRKLSATNRIVSHPDADAPDSPVHPYLASPRVAQIRRLVGDYATAVAPIAQRVIGTISAPLPNAPGPTGEEPAGEVIADSELAATAAAGTGGAVLALVNQGGVRSPGFNLPAVSYPHEVTYEEAFAVRPFGNSLVTLTLSAADLKALLEQQFPGCHGQTAHKIFQVSNGVHVTWSASAPPCARILRVTLRSPPNRGPLHVIVEGGEVLHPKVRYRITVDSYLATGGDNFSTLLKGSDPLTGPLDIDAVVSYFESNYKAPHPPLDPDALALNRPRITRLD